MTKPLYIDRTIQSRLDKRETQYSTVTRFSVWLERDRAVDAKVVAASMAAISRSRKLIDFDVSIMRER